MIDLRIPSGSVILLCLGAHPDDIEIACGATLLGIGESRQIDAHFAILTGSPDRRKEAAAAQQLFLPRAQVTAHHGDLPDGRLPQYWGEAKDLLAGVAAAIPKPDLILAPRLDDAHQDHRLVAEMAVTLWRDSLILHYEIPKWDGDFGPVTHYVAASAATAARKIEYLNQSFPSQLDRDWWDGETFLGIMRLRGVESRQRYAEAFSVRKALLSF